MLRRVMGGVEKKYPRQGSNKAALCRGKPGFNQEATSDPTSPAQTPRNRRRKSTQKRSRNSPPASHPSPLRPSRPCRFSSVASLGNHDRRGAEVVPPPPCPSRIDLPAVSGMPAAGVCCAGPHDSGEPLSLRPRQAAAWLGVSVSTLNRLTRAKRIPRLTVGRVVLYRMETLRKWLEHQEL